MISSDTNDLSFDYHLTASEQRLIINQVAKLTRGQRTACYCKITIDQQPPKKLILMRLNYLIRIYKFTKQSKCKLLLNIHILRIRKIRTIDDYTTEILYQNHKLIFKFQICDRFTHKLIRDYRYISSLVKPTAQFTFTTHNKSKYPPFKPHLSYTQGLQFFYDSLCTFYSTVYQHKLVQFFHYLTLSENVIFDLNMIHFHFLDFDKYKECDLMPAFIILRYIPYFVGITCKSMNLPKGLNYIASVLHYTSHIRFIVLSHCGLISGAKALADSIKNNQRVNLVSIDLSGNNRISDLEYLTASFEYIRNPLLSLNLGDCGMSQEATNYLIRSLIKNKKLWNLRYLDITGAKMTRECIVAFSRYFFVRSRKKSSTTNNSNSNQNSNTSTSNTTNYLNSNSSSLNVSALSSNDTNSLNSNDQNKDGMNRNIDLLRFYPPSKYNSRSDASVTSSTSSNLSVILPTKAHTAIVSSGVSAYNTASSISSTNETESRPVHTKNNDDTIKCCSLVTLKLGIILSGFSEFTTVLNETSSFLSCLSVAGTKLNEKKAKNLMLFLSYTNTLTEIDISRTSLKPSLVAQIITSIIGNKEINKFSIHLNSLNLNKLNLSKVIKAFESDPMSRLRIWTAISLEDNGMNGDDLRQLLPVLTQMVNLKELNIGMNFDSNSSSIETLLPNFLTFQSLEKLSLRGNKFHSLGYNKLQNLFISIADRQGTPLTLDIRNNDIGDEGLRDIGELARNDKFFELQVDGSTPETIKELKEFFSNVSKSKTTAVLDFPIKDAEKLITSVGSSSSKLQKAALNLSEFGVKMNVRLEKNMTDYGIHSRWTFRNPIPEIEQIVNEMTYLKHCENQSNRVFEHSLAIQTVGLPLPFQEKFEELNECEFSIREEDEGFKQVDEIYYSPSGVFVEPHDRNVFSIHYNALKMRIPGIDAVTTTTDFETSDSHSNYCSLFNEKISVEAEERKLEHLFEESFMNENDDDEEHNIENGKKGGDVVDNDDKNKPDEKGNDINIENNNNNNNNNNNDENNENNNNNNNNDSDNSNNENNIKNNNNDNNIEKNNKNNDDDDNENNDNDNNNNDNDNAFFIDDKNDEIDNDN
ncbi:barbed-end actin filament uncapping [Tritrichomonas musculus]|uniref:Barbed-end actin filament uncapping n=1 Tax=Tritrichomonas musculus TaxID=1915356 RepID=A0ABR2HWA0_9EUKA